MVLQAQVGQDFLNQMCTHAIAKWPLVVLTGLDIPIVNGIEAIEKGREDFPDVLFLVLAVFDEDDKLFYAIKAVAPGYLLKDETLGGVVQAIQQVTAHVVPWSPRIAQKASAMPRNV